MGWLGNLFRDRRQSENPAVEAAVRDLQDWQARTRMAYEAGKIDGLHYADHVETVQSLKRQDRHDDAVALLLRLVDAVEAQNAIDNAGVPGWYYEQLAIVYRKLKRPEAELAILERFSHQKPAPGPAQDKVLERLAKVRARLGKPQ